MPFSTLKSDALVIQINILQRRIYERFPQRNLWHVCEELSSQAEQAQERASWIARPIVSVWVAVIFLVGLLVSLLGYFAYTKVHLEAADFGFTEFVTLLEAGINLFVLIGAGIFFLLSLEKRVKRQRTLAALHELRSLAHVIDIHQLTKDPEHILGGERRTPSSPKESMTLFELIRYLDYCSEMLSFIGKVGALYVQDFDDEVAVSTVNDIENLTTSLSRKIWQKIMYVQSIEDQLKRDSGLTAR